MKFVWLVTLEISYEGYEILYLFDDTVMFKDIEKQLKIQYPIYQNIVFNKYGENYSAYTNEYSKLEITKLEFDKIENHQQIT